MSDSTETIPFAPPQLNRAALTMLLTALLTAAGPFWYLTRTPRLDGVLATALLILPSVLIIFGAVRLLTIRQQPELLTLGTAAFDVAKNLFVAAYVHLAATARPSAMYLLACMSLLTAFVLVSLVYRLTSWIMLTHTDDGDRTARLTPWQEGVISQLRQHRFLSICGLLVADLHLLLFLGLSIAFYDRAVRGVSIERQVHRADLPPRAAATEAGGPATAGLIRTFAFPNGSTSLRCTATASNHAFDPEYYDERNPNRWRVEQLGRSEVLAASECGDELDETAWNIPKLQSLKLELANFYNAAPYDRYRVAVVAHATDSRANTGFSSNYEMSRARAEQVQALIETMLAKLREEDATRPPLNLEWQIMPSGTGNMYLSGPSSAEAGRLRSAGLARALTTEVQFTRIPDHLTKLQRESLERGNGRGADPELQLLDYLYFMMTMASANDLAPASGFVQFVSAAGHISQLFLLVVAFNVILAFRRPLLNGEEKPEATA